MEIKKCIAKRRSNRSFNSNELEEEKILSILDAARLAPSAKNRQPWAFYIAKGRTKDKVAALMKTWYENNKDKVTSVLGTSIVIKQAPVLVLVFKDSNSPHERSDTLSIGGAIENMLLMATSLGVGSLWIADTAYVKDEVSKIVKTNMELYSAVALGYTDEKPDQRPRKTLQELILNSKSKRK